MHGQGILYLNNGDRIETTWDKGYRHGVGVIVNCSDVRSEVVYFKDLEV